MTKQTEAQRLADELDTGDFDVMTNYQAAALLRRQYELLKQALEALEKAQHAMQADMGQDQIDDAITAIRAHREAK